MRISISSCSVESGIRVSTASAPCGSYPCATVHRELQRQLPSVSHRSDQQSRRTDCVIVGKVTSSRKLCILYLLSLVCFFLWFH